MKIGRMSRSEAEVDQAFPLASRVSLRGEPFARSTHDPQDMHDVIALGGFRTILYMFLRPYRTLHKRPWA